jgi:very-short-patch-repair endonuclease
VTSVHRTLCDLAPRLAPRALERAVAEALALRATTIRRLRAVALGRRGRPGAARLLDALGDGRPALTRSPAEERFLALVRAARVPAPEVNARVGGYEVDFLWRRACLIAEIDGYTFHRARLSFERDRARDADLIASGFRVMRITWRQLNDEPGVTLDRVVRALNEAR